MCKLMKPVVQRVVRENEGQIYYVDVEVSRNKKTMKHAGVRSIPAFQVFQGGKVGGQWGGIACSPLLACKLIQTQSEEQLQYMVPLCYTQGMRETFRGNVCCVCDSGGVRCRW